MACILAFDPGQRTGFALWKPGLAKPRAGVVDMPAVSADQIGKWANAFKAWLLPFARVEGVTHIITEAPIIGGMPDIAVIIKHVGVLVTASMCADELGLPAPVKANRSRVCKHFTGLGSGKRKELKARCLLAAQAKGWNVTSEDIADALAVLDWYVHDQKIGVPWNSQPAAGPLFSGGKEQVNVDAVNRMANAAMRLG